MLPPDGQEVACRVPEAVLEEPERLPDLVHDARPVRANLVGLPEDRDLLCQRHLPFSPLGGREPGVVQPLEQLRDAAVLLEDRPRERLGGVRREDQLDRDAAGRGLDLVGRDALPREQRQRLGQRFAGIAALELVLAATPNPVMLLGDVREVEVDGERAQDDRLRLDVERLDRLRERPGGAGVTAATEPREQANALFQAVELLAFLLGEHAPEDLAEQADVRAERRVGRGVGGAAHPPHSARSRRATRPCRSASRRGRGPSPPRTRGRAAPPR